MKDPIVWSVGLAKFFLAGLVTFLIRLVTPAIGLPNVAPLMSTELAGAKAYGPWVGGLYGFVGMAAIDVVMHAFDWRRTLITSSCYAVVAIAFGKATANRQPSARSFLVASILGTLFFDAVTGCLMGPLLFGQPWIEAFIGQVIFTMKYSLPSNAAFALLAPWFYRKFADCSVELRLIGLDHVKISP